MHQHQKGHSMYRLFFCSIVQKLLAVLDQLQVHLSVNNIKKKLLIHMNTLITLPIKHIEVLRQCWFFVSMTTYFIQIAFSSFKSTLVGNLWGYFQQLLSMFFSKFKEWNTSPNTFQELNKYWCCSSRVVK